MLFRKNQTNYEYDSPSINTLQSNSTITTVIGADITFKGDIEGDTTIKIDGNVQGNIFVGKGLILGEKAQIKGNIESNSIIIYGKIEGNIRCKELIIKQTGVIQGDITTQALEVEMGGKYNGRLDMNTPMEPKAITVSEMTEKEAP